jgi:hypothetical protein
MPEYKWQRICRLHGITVTPGQAWACSFLELEGLEFCVHFGYANAEAIADERLADATRH